MPVRLRSRSSMVVMDWRALAPRERSSSSSASTPAAMAPPSARFTGGSGRSVRSRRSRRSCSRSSRCAHACQRGALSLSKPACRSGRRASDAPRLAASRGPALSSEMRESMRSISWIAPSVLRSCSRSIRLLSATATASRRDSISTRSIRGRTSDARRSRLPMGVMQQSRLA